MTKIQLLRRLANLVPDHSNDPEEDHVIAEKWLLEFVNDPEITEAWNKRRADVGWWYA